MRLKQFLSRFRLSEDALVPYPCFPVLYFFLATSIPTGMIAFDYCDTYTAIAITILSVVTGIVIFPCTKRLSLTMAALGIVLSVAHWYAPWRTYERLLPRPEVYAELRGEVREDRILLDDSLRDLSKTKNVQFMITHLRLSRDQEWRECRGRIMLSNPEYELRYGMTLHLKGALVLPAQPQFPNGFNYRKYLRSTGIKHVYRVAELNVIDGTLSSWCAAVAWTISMRERILKRMLRYIGVDRNGKILAAMTLGFRQGLDTEEKEVFLRSGMYHILAISGLHFDISFF